MNITKHEAETLVRLAASIIDDSAAGKPFPITFALNSFGEPDEVEALARRIAQAVYHDGEDLEIES